MDLIPIITIPAVYFLVALLKPYLQPRLPFNLCSICASVSFTWLLLLTLWLYKAAISPTTIGILIGMSITGIIYKSEKIYKENKIKNFWIIRLVIIVGSYYQITTLLEKNWNQFFLISISNIFLIAIFSLLFQNTTHEDVLNEHKKSRQRFINH